MFSEDLSEVLHHLFKKKYMQSNPPDDLTSLMLIIISESSQKARLCEAQLLTRTLGNLNGCRRLYFSVAEASLRSRCFSVPETSSSFQNAAIVDAEKADTAVSYNK